MLSHFLINRFLASGLVHADGIVSRGFHCSSSMRIHFFIIVLSSLGLWRKIESLPSANSRHGILQTILALLPHRHDWMLIKQSRYFFPERSPVIQKEQVHPTPPFDRSPHHAEITRQEKGTSTIFAYTSPAFHIGPKAQCKNLAVSFRAAAEIAQDLKCHISR